ncbi:leiomodin-1 [Brachionichthys hirsutus]|uniref:leiomodin-1 n=1 Tax=Brachionichthys hirsutus TaxID=412623 RepID=UPI0036046429
MSRRKVRGLTRMGRQVSEDPDLDNLLSTLSPEEMEELQQDMMKEPDLNPEVVVRGESRATQPPPSNNIGHAKLDSRRGDEAKGRLGQREQSFEGEPKKEGRKQEYLRKMGLSQEGNDDAKAGLRGQGSERDKNDDRNSRGPESMKDERSRLSSRYRRQEESDAKDETKEKHEDSKMRDKREARESTGSKTKDMISKLQERKNDRGEKERKEDCRKKDDNKTKDLISKLQEKREKDMGKEKERKSESFRTQGRVSKMLEKQSKTQEVQAPERKPEERKHKAEEKTDAQLERQPSERGEAQMKRAKEGKTEVASNHRDHAKEERTTSGGKREEESEETEDGEGKMNKAEEPEKLGNCVAKTTAKSKAKEEEEEEEDSSMFDELMEQVRSDDPSLVELNVNNSEVIKTKTLIEFAAALHHNTHVKTFALANCRADDHVAYAIAGTLRKNRTITSINLDSNHLTGKGILSLIQALLHNGALTELRFQNQRHICGGKTEMEMTKILKENTALLKLGYHFDLAGPRMTMTNILSRNMDRQRQKRLQEQKQAQANGEKKETLEVPRTGSGGSWRGSPKASPKPSPMPSPVASPKLAPKRGAGGAAPPPPPPPPPSGGPPPPPPPPLDVDSLRNSLTPVSQRKLNGKGPGAGKNSRDQLLASIRGSNVNQLKNVPVPKWLQ